MIIRTINGRRIFLLPITALFQKHMEFKPKKLRDESQLTRQTRYARALRAKLIEQLGGQCALCRLSDPAALEFDHINGRHYKPNQMSYSSRMKRYQREAELGLLRLLCGTCNKAVRKTNDNGQYIPTEHASLVPLTADLPY